MSKLSTCFLLFFLPIVMLYGQEVPKVVHFTRQQYQSQNQNWDITQRADGQLFFGNSGGLLRFDGAFWNLHPTPSGQIVRAVASDREGKIFIGGYATLGYWQASKNGRFEYHSLLEKMEGNGLGNEEIWHILSWGNRMLFQSFSTIYICEADTVRAVTPPGNIMFARMVQEKVIVPVIGQGLFELKEDDSFQFLPGSEVFKEKIVATILPFGQDQMLVCTEKDGIFIKNDNGFIPWNTPVNAAVLPLQLNKALRLHDGNYTFGTILSGIFITNPDGEILTHLNQENGLQNNTVLALFQDRNNGLWAGLDKGIDLIVPDSPLRYFQDKTGELGAVYAAALFDKKLYVGTNHGIFYKKYPAEKGEKFSLLNGSQGQTWHLQVFDDRLLGCHNAGSLQILNNRLDFIFKSTGVYVTIPHPTQPGVLLQGTYTGIIVLRKDRNGNYRVSNGLDGFFQSAKKLIFDEKNRLWVLHPRRGLFRLTLDEALQKATLIESFGSQHGLPSEFSLDLALINGEMIVKSGSRFFTWDALKQQFQPKTFIGDVQLGLGHFRLMEGANGSWFKVFSNHIECFDARKSTLRISMPAGNENIISLADSSYLFCLDDGYIILPKKNEIQPLQKNSYPPPLITAISVENNLRKLDDLAMIPQPYVFHPSENHLRFYFTSPNYAFQPAMRCRLEGFEEEWSPFQGVYNREYTNLPPGAYEFQVQTELSDELAVFRFNIEPKWYQTQWAYIVFFCMLVTLLWLLVLWHDRRMEAQMSRLQFEKERELEQQRTEATNQLLQAEVLNKSRILADTTMNLVRKNEMLMAIKVELEKAGNSKNSEPPVKAFSKMEHLIEEHLTSEEDWKVFESNFNQLHDQFFKRLKEQYPELTPGDLRLAAYLKMNLSSKEIAPLLNISVRGVENKRYRLRQKMNLDAEVNLTEYLMGF